MSKDGLNWTTLVDHQEDNRLTEPGSTATWRINVDRDSEESKAGWRHIRLQQNGKNSSGQTHYLSLSGMEIYGTVLDVCDDLGKGDAQCCCIKKITAIDSGHKIRGQLAFSSSQRSRSKSASAEASTKGSNLETHGDWSQSRKRIGLEME